MKKRDANELVRCSLAPAQNNREALFLTVLKAMGATAVEGVENVSKYEFRNGYNPICNSVGRMGFQYDPCYEVPPNALLLEVSQPALLLAMDVVAACDRAYHDGWRDGEKRGVAVGKDLLRALAAGEVSTSEFEKRDSVYVERRDGPLYRRWPGSYGA